MRVYSFRMPRKWKRPIFFVALLVFVVAAGRVVMEFLPQPDQQVSASIKNQSGKSEKDRQKFIASFGWTVEEEPSEVAQVLIPKEFDEVYTKYNEMQKLQGLDLSRYKGKKCKRYTYVLTNYPGDAKSVRLNLLVCSGKIVGGDVCSLGLDGFMHGFALEEQQVPTATPQDPAAQTAASAPEVLTQASATPGDSIAQTISSQGVTRPVTTAPELLMAAMAHDPTATARPEAAATAQ